MDNDKSKNNNSSSKKKNPHSGHRKRMKDKISKFGPQILDPHELLEVLLYFCVYRKNTNVLGHIIIDEFKTLKNVFNTPSYELKRRCNLTDYQATFLVFVGEIIRRYEEERKLKKLFLTSSIHSSLLSMVLLRDKEFETYCMIMLNKQCKIISSVYVPQNIEKGLPIDIAEMIRLALVYKSSYVIIAHNHNIDNPKPTVEDIHITNYMLDSLGNAGITIADNIIVTENTYYSMAEVGLLTLDERNNR